jgi:cell division transport system ATP-binding protein
MSINTKAAHVLNLDPDRQARDLALKTAPPPVVRFDAVSAAEGGEATLRNLSFALPQGSYYVLVGRLGSGKAALMNLIQAAAPPARGRIELFGRDVASFRPKDRALARGRIGLLARAPRFLDHLPVFDNAALAARLAGRKPAAYRDEVAQILAWVGLGKRLAELPGALTGGERRRLALARALANGPDIILAEEGAEDVDVATADRVLRLLAEVNRAGATLLVATEDESLAFRLKQPLIRLQAGRLIRIDDSLHDAPWGGAP